MLDAFNQPITEYRNSAADNLGQIRIDQDGKVYRYCKYQGSSALTSGCLVCYDLDDEDSMIQEVSVPASADLTVLAGVAVCSVLAGNSTARYAWFQIHGPHPNVYFTPENTQTTANAVGSKWKGSNGQLYAAIDATSGAAATYRNHIMNLESVAAGTASVSAAAFIYCW